ncbi:hypothetical protein [Streptomyces sp. NPDC047108]|uniref:hypothetical protein n=1 Tax=Streptomyces sp. NPDC047108 TaxID=3155025 RepID=UPI0033DAF640
MPWPFVEDLVARGPGDTDAVTWSALPADSQDAADLARIAPPLFPRAQVAHHVCGIRR